MFFFCLLVAVSSREIFEYENEFKIFLETYKKIYDGDELIYRFNVFKTNVDEIDKHNSGNYSFSQGINQFSDLTQSEFEKIMLGYISRNEVSNTVVGVHSNDVDWRNEGALTPIKDQGACGSCWAFSSTGAVEAAEFIKTGKLTSLSEQSLLDCSGSYGNQGCNGGLMNHAFEFIKAKGIPTEKDYPYIAKVDICKSYTPFVTISSYTNSRDLEKDITQQPISVAVDASTWAKYKSGILTCEGTLSLDHGVLLVGSYSDYWVIKNSWGTTWGENGFVRLSKNKGSDCGVNKEPSWPTI